MSTTVGVSARVRMRGNHFFTPLFEDTPDRGPGVAGLDEMTSGVAQLRAPLRVLQQRHDGIGELARLVGADVMQSGLDAEALGADGRGYDRPPHRQCLEDLQARAA